MDDGELSPPEEEPPEEMEPPNFEFDPGDEPVWDDAAIGAAASDISSSLSARCTECQEGTPMKLFSQHFGRNVCHECSRRLQDEYKLLTKTSCKTDYLLTDEDLATLKFVEKPNPRSKSGGGAAGGAMWNKMHLYLRGDVMRIVRERFGSEEAMELEKRNRGLERIEKQLKRRRKRKAEEDLKDKIAARVSAAVQLAGNSYHKHTFTDTELSAGRIRQVCSECEFTQHYYRL